MSNWQQVLEQALVAVDDEAELDIEEIGAEAFFEALQVDYQADLVKVYRLHILQRWHNYLQEQEVPVDERAAQDLAGVLLRRAHDDFVGSSPRAEAVLKVYQQASTDPHTVTIPVSRIRRGGSNDKAAL